MRFHVKKTSFEAIFPVWRDHLWAGRKSEIKAISPITKELVYDPCLLGERPSFWSLHTEKDELVGVISGYKAAKESYRSRGLFIFPNHRGKKLSNQLLRVVCSQAMEEGCLEIWTLPRKAAWPAYMNFGFEKKSEWFEKDMEFGPNCLAILSIYKQTKLKNDLKK